MGLPLWYFSRQVSACAISVRKTWILHVSMTGLCWNNLATLHRHTKYLGTKNSKHTSKKSHDILWNGGTINHPVHIHIFVFLLILLAPVRLMMLCFFNDRARSALLRMPSIINDCMQLTVRVNTLLGKRLDTIFRFANLYKYSRRASGWIVVPLVAEIVEELYKKIRDDD